MAERKVYLNGTFVAEQDAKISIYDSALMFGDMVFEMTRSFNKKQFKLREHLDRLFMGIKLLRIPLKMTIEEVEQACYQTIEVNEPAFLAHDEHRLMINVSRGPLGLYAPIFGGKTQPTLVIADFPLKWTVAGMGDMYDKGVNCVIPAQRSINSDLLEPKIKSRSRIHYQMANIQTSHFKGENNMALLLDNDGYVTEGTGDNVFIVKKGKIITPRGRNVLRGISRAYIFDLAKELGLPCEEADIEPFDVHEADEAFLTATPFCILPWTSLNYLNIGDGKMGPITKLLLKKWSDNVGVDIVEQIKSFNKECSLDTDAPTPYRFAKNP